MSTVGRKRWNGKKWGGKEGETEGNESEKRSERKEKGGNTVKESEEKERHRHKNCRNVQGRNRRRKVEDNYQEKPTKKKTQKHTWKIRMPQAKKSLGNPLAGAFHCVPAFSMKDGERQSFLHKKEGGGIKKNLEGPFIWK